jgi:hypothetical protein
LACNSPPPLPGDLRIGTFSLTATLDADRCGIGGDPSQPLTFEATLTGQRDTGQAFLSRAAGAKPESGRFNGQVFTVCGEAVRSFSACACPQQPPVIMREMVSARIYGAAESIALGGECPANPDLQGSSGNCAAFADGGGAGVAPFPDGGSDAVLVCGRVSDWIQFVDACTPVPDGGSACIPCSTDYRLSGNRR